MSRQATLKDFYSEGKTLLLYRLLADGTYISQAARAANMSKQLAHYYARKWERSGRLKRISKYPAIYSGGEVKKFYGGCVEGVKNLFAPHRLGATFFIKRKPKRWVGFTSSNQLNGRYIFRWLEGDFTLEVHTNKAKVWGVRLRGSRSKAALKRGVEAIRERALAFCEEQGCELSYDRLLAPVEWVISDKELSDYVAAVLKLEKPGDSRKVGGAIFCLDRSHPDKVEVKGEGATDAVNSLDWLIIDGKPTLERTAEVVKANTEVVEALALQVGDVLEILRRRKS